MSAHALPTSPVTDPTISSAHIQDFDWRRIGKLSPRTTRGSCAYEVTLTLDRKPVLDVKNSGDGDSSTYKPARGVDPTTAAHIKQDLELAARHALGLDAEALDAIAEALANGAHDGYHAMLAATAPPRSMLEELQTGDRVLFGPLRGSGEVLRGLVIGQEGRRWIVRQSVDGSGYRSGTPWTLSRDDLWLDHKPLPKWTIRQGDTVLACTGEDTFVLGGNVIGLTDDTVSIRTPEGTTATALLSETWRIEDPSAPRRINRRALDPVRHTPAVHTPPAPKKLALVDLIAAARATKAAS